MAMWLVLSAFQGDAALLSIVKEGKKLFVVGTKESVALTEKEKAVTDVKREEVYRQPLNLEAWIRQRNQASSI